MIHITKIPKILSKNSRHLTWNFSSAEKNIYLTFDDGPTPGVTEKVLELLDKYNAKATFFGLGRNVDRYPELFNQIIEKGHSIGNHSFSHVKGWKVKNQEYFQDIQLASEIINSKLFRPPYGQIKPSQTRKLKDKYTIIMWNILSGDYNKKIKPNQIIRRVLRSVRPGSIIVFHDSIKASNNLFNSLPAILEELASRGYVFKRINVEN